MPDQKPANTTIRGRLVLLTLGLLVPGLVIGAYLLWDSYEKSRVAFERQLLETARALSLVVDRELGQAASLSRALASSPALAARNLGAFERHARDVAEGKDTWIVLSDQSGKQLVNTRLPSGSQLPSVQQSELLWRELRNGSTSVSNLLVGQVPDTPVVAVSRLVKVEGRVPYALSFMMRPSVFEKILADQDLHEGWVGSILDRDLLVVARSRDGRLAIGRKPNDEVARRMAEGSSGIVNSVSMENVPTVVAYNRSPAYRWTFAVSVPRSQMASLLTGNILLAAIGGLALLILGAAVAMYVARTISRPAEGLVAAATALGRGEPVGLPKSGIREIDAVAESLRQAQGELAVRTADLRASESRLRLSVQATGIGIWDVDMQTGRRTWSDEFREIVGLPADAKPDMAAFSELIHPDDREWVNARYLDFFRGETGGFYEAEFRIRHAATGEERWIVTSGRLTDGAEGKPARASGTIMDVTERRRVEENLRESEERFRSMADSAPALIWMIDGEGRPVFFNLYHEQMFGRPIENFFDGGWAMVVLDDDLERLRSSFNEAFANRVPFHAELRVRDAEGSTRWLRCEAAPRLGGPDGGFMGYVGCSVDVTESKLAADLMERRIDERTGELAAANRQLMAQIEERERVEATLRQVQRLEAVGQLTSGVAHDFNNLLTVILGNLSFAERGASDAQLIKRLSNMRMAAERGASLVAQLLAFSRRQRLEPKAVNLNDTVGGMRELLQSSMGGSVAVDIVLEEDLWPALVDTTQMELIILNLAINARDAMEVGGLFKVETSNVTLAEEPARPEQPAPGEYVVVSVTDSGSGMSEEVLARVFEPFFTTKEVGKGSGLGLSQVLGFAKQSGGGVRIETREGKGTTVCVYIPRATEGLAQLPKKKPPKPRSPAAGVPSILLVDDDDLVREVTASKLEEMGYAVAQAENGPSALLALERESGPDLLILDFAMPGMNGAEVARAARKRRPGLPLIFVTGYADLTALGEFAGEAILHKPFRDEDLGKKVSELLKSKNG